MNLPFPRTILISLCLIVFTVNNAAIAKPDVEYLSNEFILNAKLPFSEAVKVGHLLFLSGQIGFDPVAKKLVEGGVAAETRQTMENIKATLKANKASMDDIVKCTVFIDDISKWQELNEVYVSYFKKHFPARSALGADGLALGAALEIECIAVVD